MKVSVFGFNVFYVLWPWFYLYPLLLLLGYSVLVEFLFVLDYIGVFYVVCYKYFMSAVCLIFLTVRYLNVFCIFMSKHLIAFSISFINVLINCLGFFSIA